MVNGRPGCGRTGHQSDGRRGSPRLTCALAASRGGLGERVVADPLHCAWINTKTLGNAAHTFTSALTVAQGRLDAFLQLGRSRSRSTD